MFESDEVAAGYSSLEKSAEKSGFLVGEAGIPSNTQHILPALSITGRNNVKSVRFPPLP